MNIRATFLSVLLSCFTHLLLAQEVRLAQFSGESWDQSKHNAAFVEALGGLSIYSLNYQRVTTSYTRLSFTYRISAGYIPGHTTLTGYLGGVLGKPSKAFEFLMGAGYYGVKNDNDSSVNFTDTENHNLYITPQVGYRSQKLSNGLLFRATITPWLFVNKGLSNLRYTPGFGLSIGKVF